MHEIAKWAALLFIALVALSPTFEVFDKTDGWDQDNYDLARYIMCFFCFLAFSLRCSVITTSLASFRKWIVHPVEPPRTEGNFSRTSLPVRKDRGLFLTFHDLRI